MLVQMKDQPPSIWNMHLDTYVLLCFWMNEHFDANVMTKKIKQRINKMWTLIKRIRLSELAKGENNNNNNKTKK